MVTVEASGGTNVLAGPTLCYGLSTNIQDVVSLVRSCLSFTQTICLHQPVYFNRRVI